MAVAGVDEVGRGPLAGPIVAAAVVLPAFVDPERLCGVRDSKLLPARRRTQLAQVVRGVASSWGVGVVQADELDQIGLTAANHEAMRRAVAAMCLRPDALLLDAFTLPDSVFPQIGAVHGDSLCVSIAAASIVAKVERDAMMDVYDAVFPQYGFAEHCGYATARHLAALREHGPSPIHRRSFAPVRQREP